MSSSYRYDSEDDLVSAGSGDDDDEYVVTRKDTRDKNKNKKMKTRTSSNIRRLGFQSKNANLNGYADDPRVKVERLFNERGNTMTYKVSYDDGSITKNSSSIAGGSSRTSVENVDDDDNDYYYNNSCDDSEYGGSSSDGDEGNEKDNNKTITRTDKMFRRNKREKNKSKKNKSPIIKKKKIMTVESRKPNTSNNSSSSRKVNFNRYDFNPVIVVDYDLTLVDDRAQPFPGSKEFITRLRDFNDGQMTLVLYSHANAAHIDHGMAKYYHEIKDYFDEIISDHSARNNKPVTHVRRVISSLASLSGPFVIIDDLRSNLDNDQYDIVIDVTRFTRFKRAQPIEVNYDGILCLLTEGVETFLKTKTPNL